MTLERSLLQFRWIERSEPTGDGLGHRIELACGHTVFMSVLPRQFTYCGVCLQALVAQIRELQAQQRIE